MHADNLIWIDLEMTGLNPLAERIIEIATVVTTPTLEVIAEGPVLAIYQPDFLLASMDEWNTNQHRQSGLYQRVRESRFSEAEAEQQTLAFLQQYVPAGKSPICGNSVCQDKQFLLRYMPKLADYFHYRMIDVSTIKELARRWAPKVCDANQKAATHLALADIHDSINELKHYRQELFKPL